MTLINLSELLLNFKYVKCKNKKGKYCHECRLRCKAKILCEIPILSPDLQFSSRLYRRRKHPPITFNQIDTIPFYTFCLKDFSREKKKRKYKKELFFTR